MDLSGKKDGARSLGPRVAGFTILELVTASAIMGLVMVLLASILSTTQQGLTKLSNKAKQRQSAQVVLANLADELRMSIMPARGSYEAANTSCRQPQLLINPPDVDASFRNAHCIFWPSAIGSTKGGAGLVGYGVRWENTDSGPQPRLCRMFLDAGKTQPVLAAHKVATAPLEWANTSMVDQSAPGDVNNGYQGWLADNILALYARALDPEMKPITAYARKITGVSFDAYNQSSVAFSGPVTGSSCGNQFDSSRGYQYRQTVGNVLVNRFGPALPAAVELVAVSAPPRAIRNLKQIPPAVSSSDPNQFWQNVDAFVASLPASVRSETSIYSTIVPIGQ